MTQKPPAPPTPTFTSSFVPGPLVEYFHYGLDPESGLYSAWWNLKASNTPTGSPPLLSMKMTQEELLKRKANADTALEALEKLNKKP